MSLDKAMKNLKYDRRMTEWNINNGQMTREEFQKYLDSLPDLSHNVSLVNLVDLDSDMETSEEGH